MLEKSDRKGLPEKPKFNGQIVWCGNKAYYAEAEEYDGVKVEEVDEEEKRKYLGTKVEWERNRVYLKEVFEGDEDDTIHEIGGRVQPKESGKIVWNGNIAYYEPAEGVDAWDDTRCAPSPYEMPKLIED